MKYPRVIFGDRVEPLTPPRPLASFCQVAAGVKSSVLVLTLLLTLWATFHDIWCGFPALRSRGDFHHGAPDVDVFCSFEPESLHETAFDADRVSLAPVRLANAMHDPHAAILAEIAVHRSAFLRGSRPAAELGLEFIREGEKSLGGEDGARPESRRRLFLTFGAVAVVNRHGDFGRGLERDVSALA